MNYLMAMSFTAYAQDEPKPASEATKAANEVLRNSLPFSDTTDFENARRGFIASIEGGKIKDVPLPKTDSG